MSTPGGIVKCQCLPCHAPLVPMLTHSALVHMVAAFYLGSQNEEILSKGSIQPFTDMQNEM